jgi:hypothetical protein
MKIYNSQIVTVEQDKFWDTPEHIKSIKEKPILILAESFDINSDTGAMFEKMTTNSGLSKEQFNLIHITRSTLSSWHSIRDKANPKLVINFGINPKYFGIIANLAINELTKYDNCYWYITSPLSTISANQELKSILWLNFLKPAFVEDKFGIADMVRI